MARVSPFDPPTEADFVEARAVELQAGDAERLLDRWGGGRELGPRREHRFQELGLMLYGRFTSLGQALALSLMDEK